MIDFKGFWDDPLPLTKFVYNNSYHSIIDMAPFESLYGNRSLIEWVEVGEYALISPILVHETIEKICFYLTEVENNPKSTQVLREF